MSRFLPFFIILSSLFLLFISCSSSNHSLLERNQATSLKVPDLDCCDNFKQQTMILNPKQEVVILVHGCKASSGRFSTLKKVFDSRGQQAICFSYDYRNSIEDCAMQLVTAINTLTNYIDPSKITIVAHSQGGLVARRAISVHNKRTFYLENSVPRIRLVTISSPFNGIKASSHCGSTALHIATGGITVLICKAIAGSTWSEINPSSDFINNPGNLSDKVYNHLKINTDEEGTCRSSDSQGNCLESDYIFGLDEQYREDIDKDERVVNIELKAGHAQVIGTPGRPPMDLIAVLEEYDVLNRNPYLSNNENIALLNRLYR